MDFPRQQRSVGTAPVGPVPGSAEKVSSVRSAFRFKVDFTGCQVTKSFPSGAVAQCLAWHFVWHSSNILGLKDGDYCIAFHTVTKEAPSFGLHGPHLHRRERARLGEASIPNLCAQSRRFCCTSGRHFFVPSTSLGPQMRLAAQHASC